jgi:type I restriction enzyme S subunit
VLLSSRAPIGYVAIAKNPLATNQGFRNLVLKPGFVPGFVYYWLMAHIPELERHASGSTFKELSGSSLKQIRINVPSESTQHAIAHILGTLDDKIELNRRMNETLEAIARAIFKSWFVDFDPVIDNALATGNSILHALAEKAACRLQALARAKVDGRERGLPKHIADLFPDRLKDSELGPIPAEWQVVELGEIAEVIDCLHSKKPERRESGWPLLQLWNIRNDGLIDMADTYHIEETDYKNWVSRMEASSGDCVITNVGRVGAVAQIPEGLKAALGRNMTGIRCKSTFRFPTFLIECLLSQRMRDEIAFKIDTGTILDALNVRNIPKLRLVQPQPDLLIKFEELARPLRARMEHNLTQSSLLAALRDALLPKLISGELRVKNAEDLFGRWV